MNKKYMILTLSLLIQGSTVLFSVNDKFVSTTGDACVQSVGGNVFLQAPAGDVNIDASGDVNFTGNVSFDSLQGLPDFTLSGKDATDADTDGGDVSVLAGDGTGSGFGGTVSMMGGAGGTSSAAHGGDVVINAGIGGSASTSYQGKVIITSENNVESANAALNDSWYGDDMYPSDIAIVGGENGEDWGGSILVLAGHRTDSEHGGDCYIMGGNSESGDAGNVTLAGGIADNNNRCGSIALYGGEPGVGNGDGGNIDIRGGNGTLSGGNHKGGYVDIRSGVGRGASSAGIINIQGGSCSGSSSTGAGGTVDIQAGSAAIGGATASFIGGDAALNTGSLCDGGKACVKGGAAATSGGASTGGDGGDVEIAGGNGATVNTGGSGGSVLISAGVSDNGASGSNKAGGDVTLTAGLRTGTGTHGQINVEGSVGSAGNDKAQNINLVTVLLNLLMGAGIKPYVSSGTIAFASPFAEPGTADGTSSSSSASYGSDTIVLTIDRDAGTLTPSGAGGSAFSPATLTIGDGSTSTGTTTGGPTVSVQWLASGVVQVTSST